MNCSSTLQSALSHGTQTFLNRFITHWWRFVGWVVFTNDAMLPDDIGNLSLFVNPDELHGAETKTNARCEPTAKGAFWRFRPL